MTRASALLAVAVPVEVMTGPPVVVRTQASAVKSPSWGPGETRDSAWLAPLRWTARARVTGSGYTARRTRHCWFVSVFLSFAPTSLTGPEVALSFSMASTPPPGTPELMRPPVV